MLKGPSPSDFILPQVGVAKRVGREGIQSRWHRWGSHRAIQQRRRIVHGGSGDHVVVVGKDIGVILQKSGRKRFYIFGESFRVVGARGEEKRSGVGRGREGQHRRTHFGQGSGDHARCGGRRGGKRQKRGSSREGRSGLFFHGTGLHRRIKTNTTVEERGRSIRHAVLVVVEIVALGDDEALRDRLGRRNGLPFRNQHFVSLAGN